ncbi:hypothetical protein DFR42_12129 [Undibacterium pigrum]|uniref:Uncharacterized protein n=2 Tax=Undibacterium pigrum TaxID=401470 RepID=A0A318IRJ9_9BURK|nr:hypothetical protein DFR42_12129 [Undibacterium pigrum]
MPFTIRLTKIIEKASHMASIFIHETDASKLQQFDVENLDDYSHVCMDELLTLDFEIMCQGTGQRWCLDQPFIYDESNGLVLCLLHPTGLDTVLSLPPDEDDIRADDMDKLRRFINVHGKQHIFELSTF